MNWFAILAFVMSLTIAVVIVPVVRSIAIRLGLVDNPDAERKLHQSPIALAGGVGIFISMLATIVFIVGSQNGWNSEAIGQIVTKPWLVLLGASLSILLVGLADDKWTLRGRQKLLAQCLIAMVIVGSGTSLKVVGIFGYDLPLGIFAIPVSVLWLLLAINALNLLDGADGMTTTVGIFVAGSLAIISLHNGNHVLTVISAFALCGALSGFLVYNRPPASIFLGDAGSMMIGLIIGVLAMWCSLKGSTVIAAAPIAILVLPLFDSSAAIIRRTLTGRSIYATDRGHLHHLLNEKFGRGGTLVVVAIACAVSSATAIASTWWNLPWVAAIGPALVLGALVGTRTFGYSETRLLAGRLRHLAKSFLARPQFCDHEKLERSLKMQGDGPWHDVWEPLVEFAEKQGLASVKIDANMAWLHESYHGSWRSIRLPEKAFQSVVRIPLFVDRVHQGETERVPIGRLEIVANSTPNSLDRLSDFLSHAAELQDQVQRVVHRLEGVERSPAPVTPSSGDRPRGGRSDKLVDLDAEFVAHS